LIGGDLLDPGTLLRNRYLYREDAFLGFGELQVEDALRGIG